MEVGVKESSKKKMVRSTWAGHVEKWELKKWQREQKVNGKWRRGRFLSKNCLVD